MPDIEYTQETENQHPVDKALICSLSSMSLYARSIVKNIDVAEGIVQEACRRILERRQNLLSQDIKSYAMTVVHNLAMDHFRQREFDFDSSEAEDPLVDLEGHMEASRLLTLLQRVGEECSRVLTLVGLGYKQREIADLLRVAIGTISSTVSRCRERLEQMR
jgi:RNA polymerase sigma factor (sigma-70 family)